MTSFVGRDRHLTLSRMDGMDAQDLEGSRRRPSDAVTPLGVCLSVCGDPAVPPFLNLELANRSRPGKQK